MFTTSTSSWDMLQCYDFTISSYPTWVLTMSQCWPRSALQGSGQFWSVIPLFHSWSATRWPELSPWLVIKIDFLENKPLWNLCLRDKKRGWLNLKAQHGKESPHSVCVTVQEKDCRLTDGLISLSQSLTSLIENFISNRNVRERIRMNMYLISKDKFLWFNYFIIN